MLQELRVVLFGGLNNILKGQPVEEIAKEFDSLYEDIKHANPSSWVSWATLPLPPGAVSFKPEEVNKPNNRLTNIDKLNEVIKQWNTDRCVRYVSLHRVGVRSRFRKVQNRHPDTNSPMARVHRDEDKVFDKKTQLHISVPLRQKYFKSCCDILL